MKFKEFLNEASTEVNPSGEEHNSLPTMDAVEKKVTALYKKSKVFELIKKAGFTPKLISVSTKNNMQYHVDGEYISNRYGIAKLELKENGVDMFITFSVYGAVPYKKKTTTWREYVSIIIDIKKPGYGQIEITNNIKKIISIDSPALVKNVKSSLKLFDEDNEKGLSASGMNMPHDIQLTKGSARSVSNGGWPDSYSS